MKRFLIIVFLLAAIFGTGCQQTCLSQTEEYRASVNDIISRFEDSVDLAANTSRIGLGTPITQLQEIKRDFEGLDVPECAQTAHDNLELSMFHTIEAFLAFSAQEDDETVAQRMENAAMFMDRYNEEMSKIENPGEN